MVDALDAATWPVAVAVIVTLLTDPAAAERAAAATAATADQWSDAARCGLQHPGLAASAEACFAATLEALARTGASTGLRDAVADHADRYVARGRCPADDRLDEWHGAGRLLPEGTPDEEAAWVS
jgi:glutamate--cysteine ligase